MIVNYFRFVFDGIKNKAVYTNNKRLTIKYGILTFITISIVNSLAYTYFDKWSSFYPEVYHLSSFGRAGIIAEELIGRMLIYCTISLCIWLSCLSSVKANSISFLNVFPIVLLLSVVELLYLFSDIILILTFNDIQIYLIFSLMLLYLYLTALYLLTYRAICGQVMKAMGILWYIAFVFMSIFIMIF